MPGKRIIWIISEGSPGHVSQSAGLAAALAEIEPAEIRQFECRPRLKGFVRHLIRLLWMRKNGTPLPDSMLYGPLGLERPLNGEPPPDLIIASGGRSVFAARTLAVRHGAPFIFLGERKPYPADWFHTVFTPSALETAPNDIRMDLIPTKITPVIVRQAAADWAEKPPGPLRAMLIGGKSRSHRFENADWLALATGMAELARRENFRWLVTTSRRTGEAAENLIRDTLPPESIADAVWWCAKPERKLAAYLGAAAEIWVTQDSVSMATEAIAAGKPVVLAAPLDLQFPATSFMPGYLENLESLGLVRRVPISKMTEPATASATPPRPPRTTETLAEIARQRLGWA